MKKTFILFLTILFFSCSSNISSKIDQDSEEKSNANSSAHENLNESLKLISYLTGRVLLNDIAAKGFIENSLLNSGNNTVNFNTVINTNNDFSVAFYNEFSIWLTGFDDAFGHNRPRPIPDIGTDFLTGIMNPSFNNNPDSDSNTEGYQFFMYVINQNNIELYFPRPLILEDVNNTYFTEHLYITKHPLLEEFPIGIDLWQNFERGDNQGEFLLFDDEFLNRTSANIIVVRPSRNREFPYENYHVDFERFYYTQ